MIKLRDLLKENKKLVTEMEFIDSADLTSNWNAWLAKNKSYKARGWIGRDNNSRGYQFFVDDKGRILDLRYNKLPKSVKMELKKFLEKNFDNLQWKG